MGAGRKCAEESAAFEGKARSGISPAAGAAKRLATRGAKPDARTRTNRIGRALRVAMPPGILLAARLLVSRAGALQGPISPTYQHAGANQMKRENHRSFLLLLFLTATAPVEFRYGAVIAFQFADVSVRLPLGHKAMSADSERPRQLRERDHYGLICSQRRFSRSRGRAMMFSQVWSASDI